MRQLIHGRTQWCALLLGLLLTACQSPDGGTAAEAPADSAAVKGGAALGTQALDSLPLLPAPAPNATPGSPVKLAGWMGNYVFDDWNLMLKVSPEGVIKGQLDHKGTRTWQLGQSGAAAADAAEIAAQEYNEVEAEVSQEWRRLHLTLSPDGKSVTITELGLTLGRFEMTFEEAFDTLTYRDGWGPDRKELRMHWNPPIGSTVSWVDAAAGAPLQLKVLGKSAEPVFDGGVASILLTVAPNGRFLWIERIEQISQMAVIRWAGEKEYQPAMYRHDPLRPLLELKDSLVYQFERSPVGMGVAEHELQYLCVLEKGQVRIASRSDENGPWEWLTVELQPETPGVGDHFKVRRANGERPRELFFNGFMLYAMFDDREAVYNTYYTFQRN